MRTLVAYASQHGATRGVAERLAQRLAAGGLDVDVQDVDTQPGADPYDAVVLGSAVQGGAWLPQAIQYAHRNLHALARKPVWLFSVGLQPTASRHHGPFRRMIARAVPKDVEPLQWSLHTVDHHAFAGAVTPEATPHGEAAIFTLLGGAFGDYRDWDDVDAWADGIADTLKA